MQKLFLLFMALATLGLTGCGDDDDGHKHRHKSAKQMLHDCMWDESGKCQKKLGAAMNDPRYKGAIENIVASDPAFATKMNNGQLTQTDWDKVQLIAQKNEALLSNTPSGSTTTVAVPVLPDAGAGQTNTGAGQTGATSGSGGIATASTAGEASLSSIGARDAVR